MNPLPLTMAVLLLWPQSLGELGRREAERRRETAEPEKVITEADLRRAAADAPVSVFSLPPGTRPPPKPPQGPRASPARYRTALAKLDREIRIAEERLAALRARLEAERWSVPKTRGRGGTRSGASRPSVALQIQEWEAKLRRLKLERRETYDEGRRAGFQPGELDGHGRMP